MSNHENTSKDIFDVVGDVRDPAGIDPSTLGIAAEHDFTKSAAGRPLIWYGHPDVELMTWDVFELPGQASYIIGLCPRCLCAGVAPDKCGLMIKESDKPFEYGPDAMVPPFPDWTWAQMEEVRLKRSLRHWGRLTIEKVIVDPVCGWKGQLANNVLRDTR